MSWWLRFLAAGVLMLPLAARAQVLPVPDSIPPLVADYMAVKGLGAYDVATLPPKEIVAAAFGTDYGRALVAELGDILMDSADKSCLGSRKLGGADLARGAGEIYQRYGTQMLDVSRSCSTCRPTRRPLRRGRRHCMRTWRGCAAMRMCRNCWRSSNRPGSATSPIWWSKISAAT